TISAPPSLNAALPICIVESQATIVDPQSAQLQGLAAVVLEAEIPVAGAAVGARLQAYVRLHQAQLGQSDLARQKWPELELQRKPLGGGHVRLLRPFRVAQPQAGGGDRG